MMEISFRTNRGEISVFLPSEKQIFTIVVSRLVVLEQSGIIIIALNYVNERWNDREGSNGGTRYTRQTQIWSGPNEWKLDGRRSSGSCQVQSGYGAH